MRPEINVNDFEINYAESILLPEGYVFDEEARNFIKNWNTIDLQAVPGSGKTTALLAKLLILDKRLPFKDNSGVAVLSHTNTAVNEIKDKIGTHCSNLFAYPNFVGTIQSFVDLFLANPFYNNRYAKKLVRIDNDTYRRSHYIPSPRLKTWLGLSQNNIGIFHNSRLMIDGRLCIGYPPKNISLGADTPTFKTIRTIKKSIRDSGHISFDEAYIFADEYINKFPCILNVIQERFSYVFVDEVQDMDLKQYSLLEKVFAVDGDKVSFQRIGDLNQAIYHDNGSAGDIWKNRSEVLTLASSRRLTPNIAKAVEPFGLNPIKINGCRVSEEDIQNIKPHIILYDNNSITQVLEKFTEIIGNFADAGAIEMDSKTSHIAIGWTTESNFEKGHIKLDGYYPNFEKNNSIKNQNFDSLDELLKTSSANNQSKFLKHFRDDIFTGLLNVLKLEGVKNSDGRNFTVSSIFKYLTDEKPEHLVTLNEKVTDLAFQLMKGKLTEAVVNMRVFCPTILEWFDKEVNNSRIYIESERETKIESAKEDLIEPNVYIGKNDVKICISTIHSVKGQTHTTVLYLETFFQKDYESPRLAEQFASIQFTNTKIRHVQSTKMAYVGFSRPTHLLCVAIHKDNFESKLKKLNLQAWEIIDIES